MSRSLEMTIALRYLRARRGSRLLSFISLIAIGGVVVGVSALIVVMAVMNGLQRDLREKILIGSPDLRLLTFGQEMNMPDWRTTLEKVRKTPNVIAAAPWVHTKGLVRSGPNLPDMAFISGIEPQGRGVAEVTSIRNHAVQGDFRFASSDGLTRGVVVGDLLANRLGVVLGDTLTLMTASPKDISASTGQVIPNTIDFQVTPEGFVETSVSDTGCGIDPGYIAKLFREFSKVQSANPSAQGAQLGLFITKSLVAMHKGAIWVDSTPGVGTRFVFTMPVAAETGVVSSES